MILVKSFFSKKSVSATLLTLAFIFGSAYQELQAVKVAVMLFGCGAAGGTEVCEAVYTITALSRRGAQVDFFAPDTKTADSEKIARQKVNLLSSLKAAEFDALIIPGGNGYKDFTASVTPLINSFNSLKKPVGAMCASTNIVAETLKGFNPTMYTGEKKFGKHVEVRSEVSVVDKTNRIVSTPAFLAAGAKPHQVQSGIEDLVKNVLTLTSQPLPKVAPLPTPIPQPEKQAVVKTASPIGRTRTGSAPARRGPVRGARRTSARAPVVRTSSARRAVRRVQRRRR